MKNRRYLVASAAYIVLFVCAFLISASTKLPDPAVSKIQGSWTLFKYKYGTDQQLTEVPSLVSYVKHITPRHFAWASYGKNGNLVGAGGGTYELKEKTYVENIAYFHPHGSNLPGTSISFKYQVEGNNWTISGYIKNIQLNPGSGEYELVDSVFLEEVWRKL